ncbi:MAG: response regulator [Rhodocyclales bacterium]|nr:response regulator [Rhodocyclales bacterium]
MTHLEDISVLIVEASPGMRAQLRTLLGGAHISKQTFVASALAAVDKLRTQRFDLILCEYALGDGQDGQHLLEDLRTRQIIPLDTVFIMISSERNYERVIGAAELAPNDYILKPLTPGTLYARLERAFARREVLLPVHQLMEAGNLPEAAELCQQAQQGAPRHWTQFMRLRAQLLEELGRTDEAEAAYREVLELKPAPWAHLGLARMLFANRQLDAAEATLESLIGENPDYIDAYDWLARVRQEAGHLEQAQFTLASALERSPHRISRLRHLGEVALATGDFVAAEQALAEVVRKGKHSAFRDPEDHVRLVKAQLIQKHIPDATATIRDLEQSSPDRPEATACCAYSHALLCASTGNDEGARVALREATDACREATSMPPSFKHEVAQACLDHRLEAEGSELIADLLRSAPDSETAETIRHSLKARGRADLSTRIEEKLHNEVKEYIAAGAARAHAGDYDGAVREMMHAVRKMPGNPHVLFNAALALLRHMEENGWNERFAARARTLIAHCRKVAPDHPRLDAITNLLHSLMARYGIHAETVPVPIQPLKPDQFLE